MENGRQLFVLDKDIWNSIDIDVVKSTANDLIKLNLFNPPFADFDIKSIISDNDYQKFYKTNKKVNGSSDVCDIFRYHTFIKNNDLKYNLQIKSGKNFYTLEYLKNLRSFEGCSKEQIDYTINHLTHMSLIYVSTLLVLLTTKNAEKHTEAIKQHGPKSRKRPREYSYITTIKIGKITETMRSEGAAGAPVRPHLRRGHIRNQRFGEGLKESKQIFIQPVFVNADEGWIENQRKEYRIKL